VNVAESPKYYHLAASVGAVAVSRRWASHLGFWLCYFLFHLATALTFSPSCVPFRSQFLASPAGPCAAACAAAKDKTNTAIDMHFTTDMRFEIVLKGILMGLLCPPATGFSVRNSTQQVLGYLHLHYATFYRSPPAPAKKYSPKASPCSHVQGSYVQAAQSGRQMRSGFERRNLFPLSFTR
jgi:hypothetical protein